MNWKNKIRSSSRFNQSINQPINQWPDFQCHTEVNQISVVLAVTHNFECQREAFRTSELKLFASAINIEEMVSIWPALEPSRFDQKSSVAVRQ